MTTVDTRQPLVKRAKKAFVAGFWAAVGAFGTAVVATANGEGVPDTSAAWAALIMGALGVGVVAAVATFNARNAGTVNGSDPV